MPNYSLKINFLVIIGTSAVHELHQDRSHLKGCVLKMFMAIDLNGKAKDVCSQPGVNLAEIKEIPAESTYQLRHKILRPNQNISDCEYPGDHLEGALHLGAFDDGKLIGIASFSPEMDVLVGDNATVRLRGMGVVRELRGQGIGKEILSFSEKILKEREEVGVWCRAREIAFKFYRDLGFEYCSELYDIEGIGPHKTMFKRLIR